MAQRLILSRALSLSLARRMPVRGWAPSSAGILQATTTRNSSGGSVVARLAWLLYGTRNRKITFHIRDGLDFEERVLNSNKPVVVDFYALWCRPCKILGPRLEKMVAREEGKVVMAKVDIDENTDIAIALEVLVVPTVLAIKNGEVVDKFVGIKDEEQLETFLKKLISC